MQILVYLQLKKLKQKMEKKPFPVKLTVIAVVFAVVSAAFLSVAVSGHC